SLPNLDPAAVHGLDALTCGSNGGNGTTFTIADAPTVQFGTGDWGLAFVYKPASQSTISVALWNKGGAINLSQQGPTYQVTDGTSKITGSFTGTNFQYVVARGTALSLQTPTGSSTGPTATSDVSASGVGVSVCDNDSINSGQAEVAEVIAVKGTVADADVTNLLAYFQAKFGL
ncbi:MAG TPA: hypothetical protein VIY73_07885, partial [Polyangiaceae bacterium]